MQSAYIGQPPNTQEDFYIVRGILRKFFIDADPSKGAHIPPTRPPDAPFETRGPQIVALNIVIITLIILITAVRLMIRALHRGLTWGWDDWTIILGVAGVVAWFSLSIAMVDHGGGKHIWSLTYNDYLWFNKFGIVKQFLFRPASTMVKISITLFIRRITGASSRAWRITNNLFLGILVAVMVISTVCYATLCISFRLDYLALGKLAYTPKCNFVPSARLIYGLAVTDVILHLCLLSTPIILLWKIQMDRWRKFGFVAASVLGSISSVGAIMLVVSYNQIKQDTTWNYLALETWILIDLFFGVIVASLPVLYGQLPKTWSIFRAYTRSYLHSNSHRSQTLHKMTSGTDRTKSGIYHRDDDLESKSNHGRSEGDETELLEQRKPIESGNAFDINHTKFIIGKDADSNSATQQSREESPESRATRLHWDEKDLTANEK